MYLRTGKVFSTPRVSHKGRQPLIKCAHMTSICFIFPFTFFMSVYALCIFYFFVVDKGVSLAPTDSSIVIRKSDLRSSLRTKRWLSCFCPFFARYIVTNTKKGHFTMLDPLNDLLILLKGEKTLRHWTINDLLFS